MTDARWTRLEDLFGRLVDAPGPERARLLDEECADDPSLRAEVEALLAADQAVGDRIRRVVDGAVEHLAPSLPPTSGQRLGPYTLLEPIGRGGMGTVYLAKRADDAYDSTVAVKVLRPLHGADASERFRVERRILATLDHPSIARLLDGGEADTGHSYLVMEHVEGEPIDAHCAHRGLSVHDRVTLFRRVCEAVQYAHGRLIVHRDLKPANVLVDAEGRVKLLDFGIAKLLGPAGDVELRTRTGVRPMTPSYASPEQVRGESASTASDVYALGVLLYELLTGALPYPTEGRTTREIEDAILDHAPEAPSRRAAVGTTARQASAGGSTTRGPSSIGQDLDTIVLKALDKDPTRRYESVERLSEDLRRYLEGRPIRARPDTWTYRASKFVGRNRGAVVGGVATAISIVFFALGSAVQAYQLERQRDAARTARDEAQAVTTFLVDVFGATDPNEAQGLDVTAREILASAGTRVRDEFRDQPAVQGAVLTAIGRAYQRLGANDSAVALLEASVDRAADAYGEGTLEHAEALRWLGAAFKAAGDAPRAKELYQQVLDLRIERLGPDDLETGDMWNNLGGTQADLGEYEAAEASFLEALRVKRLYLDPSDESLITTLGNVGSNYVDMGRDADAIDYTLMALEGERLQHAGADHLDVAIALNNYASALQYGGRPDEAEPFYLESLEIRERLLPADHPSVLVARNNLGNYYGGRGRSGDAVRILESILPARRERGEPIPLAVVLNNYGQNLGRLGRNEESIAALGESLSLMTEVWGPDHPRLAYPQFGLARANESLGRDAEAERWYRASNELRRETLGTDDTLYLDGAHELGVFLLDRGRPEEAEPWLADAYLGRSRVLAEDDPDRIDSMIAWARLRARAGYEQEARALLEEAVTRSVAARGDQDGRAEEARGYLAELDTGSGGGS